MHASLRTTARDKDSQVKPPIQSGLLPLKQKKIAGVKEIIASRVMVVSLSLIACFMGQQHSSVVLSIKRHGSHLG